MYIYIGGGDSFLMANRILLSMTSLFLCARQMHLTVNVMVRKLKMLPPLATDTFLDTKFARLNRQFIRAHCLLSEPSSCFRGLVPMNGRCQQQRVPRGRL